MAFTIQGTKRGNKTVYGYTAVSQLIDWLTENGYELVQLEEGTLGAGDIVMVPPEEGMYHFIISETFINSWTSAHTIRRRVKLGAELQAQVDAAIDRRETA